MYGGNGLVAKSCPTLASPWTAAHQAPLSMGFPRQECWSALSFPSLYIYLYIVLIYLCICVCYHMCNIYSCVYTCMHMCMRTGGSVVKNPPANAGDAGLISGSGEILPGERNGCPLQYSCLGNPTDRETWQATVHGVTKD